MDILDKHKEIWNKKSLIRKIYSEWYRMILNALSIRPGITLEIGSGTGNFKDYKSDIITSDIVRKSWLDMCFDAHKIPYKNNSVQNLVMVDVFHHLEDPAKFLDEGYRVLKSGGRMIMIEPFPSFFSKIIYNKFHPEPFIFDVNYFRKRKRILNKKPWRSNQAIPYNIFFKDEKQFKRRYNSKYKILKKQKFSFILYPLSGGFENRQLYPDFMYPALRLVETTLIPFRNLISFRCFVVLEKI